MLVKQWSVSLYNYNFINSNDVMIIATDTAAHTIQHIALLLLAVSYKYDLLKRKGTKMEVDDPTAKHLTFCDGFKGFSEEVFIELKAVYVYFMGKELLLLQYIQNRFYNKGKTHFQVFNKTW